MKFFINNSIIKKEYFLIIAYILSIITASIVFISGGTYNVFTNLIYIPIALASATNGIKRGVFHAFISGLMIGPLMPLEIFQDAVIMQNSFSCMVRILLYSIIAFIIGYFEEERNKEYTKNIYNEKEINEEQIAMIFALVKLSESRDNFLDTHIERVGVLCKFLASKLKEIPRYSDYVTYDYIENIFKASQLHDIGKVGIPDSILLKPGKLSNEEFNVMKNHTLIGANTLHEVQENYPHNKFLNIGICIAKYHHEKWDGTGYPIGLAGENIPLSARIMAIVDVYDALSSKRIYKEAFSHDESLEIIKQGLGIHFDPLICKVFLENGNELKNIYENLTIDKFNNVYNLSI